MNSSKLPEFSSSELQEVVNKARPILEGIDEARNQVSRDVRVLETYLQALDLQTEFRLPFGRGFDPADGPAGQFCEGSASGKIEEDALIWGQTEIGQWRLLYEVCRWDGGVEVDSAEFRGGDPLYWDPTTLKRELKPLIESKFEIRKRMYQHLPDFVKQLARHLALDPDSTPGLEEELPF